MGECFSVNELQIVHAFCLNPKHSDNDVAEISGIKRSTVTKIRNRLMDKNLLKFRFLPNFNSIKCELISVIDGDFNPSTPYDIRKKYLPSSQFDQVFFVGTTDLQHISFTASKNFTESRRYKEYMEQVYGKHGFLSNSGNKYTYFPIKLSNFYRFFDFEQYLDYKINQKKTSLKSRNYFKENIKQLSENEIKILSLMISNFDLNDQELALKSGLSRQTVNQIKNKLIKNKDIYAKCIPDLKSLGVKFLVFRKSGYKPSSTLKQREREIQGQLDNPGNILLMSSNLESVSIDIFESFDEIERYTSEYLKNFSNHLNETPVFRIFSVSNMNLKETGYSEITDKIIKDYE